METTLHGNPYGAAARGESGLDDGVFYHFSCHLSCRLGVAPHAACLICRSKARSNHRTPINPDIKRFTNA